MEKQNEPELCTYIKVLRRKIQMFSLKAEYFRDLHFIFFHEVHFVLL